MLSNIFNALMHMILPSVIAGAVYMLFSYLSNKGNSSEGINIYKIISFIFKTAGNLLIITLYMLLMIVGISSLKDGDIKASLSMFVPLVLLSGRFYEIIKKPFLKVSVDFKNQTIFCLLLLLVSFCMHFAFGPSYIINICLALCGFMFIGNPVYPPKFSYLGEKRCKREAFTAGVILVLAGLIINFKI